jgi:hypothetical protein
MQTADAHMTETLTIDNTQSTAFVQSLAKRTSEGDLYWKICPTAFPPVFVSSPFEQPALEENSLERQTELLSFSSLNLPEHASIVVSSIMKAEDDRSGKTYYLSVTQLDDEDFDGDIQDLLYTAVAVWQIDHAKVAPCASGVSEVFDKNTGRSAESSAVYAALKNLVRIARQ